MTPLDKTLIILGILGVLACAGFAVATWVHSTQHETPEAGCHTEHNSMGYQRTVCNNGSVSSWVAP